MRNWILMGLLAMATWANLPAQTADSTQGLKAYELLKIPGLKNRVSASKPIVVAVVDDGFNLTHKALEKYYYHNEQEIPNNGIDDDGNGYLDDYMGFDVSDHDNDVSIRQGGEMIYYHGTMVAGTITREAEMAFGPDAWKYVKILPVKVLADKATKTYILDGYDGIEYAIKLHADIIVCAWSGGDFDSKHAAMFNEAAAKGILIVGSAGNAYTGNVDPPASLQTVYAVAAVDSTLKKIPSSNYGKKVDLAASGDLVYAPHPVRDNAYSFLEGTSAAVSLVGGAAAILKVLKPDATPNEVMTALKYTATPVDSINQSYTGKLGAGLPNVTDAANYLLNPGGRDAYFNPARPKGEVWIDKSTTRSSWTVQPKGGFTGFALSLTSIPKSASKGKLSVYTGDSLVTSGLVKDLPKVLTVSQPTMKITYEGKKSNAPLVLRYEVNPIDSPRLYCSSTIEMTGMFGTITDGSGNMDYANNCDCKWLITVPDSMRIKLTFDQFDTEAKVDFVWLFDGSTTQPDYQLAQFSGPGLPPVIISRYHQVLVWFTTNGNTTGKGWRLQYQAVTDAPGVLSPINKPAH